MSMGIPADLAAANAYRQQFALMLEHTTKPIVFVCDDRADCEAIVAMAAAAAGGMEQLRLNPTLLLYSEPIDAAQALGDGHRQAALHGRAGPAHRPLAGADDGRHRAGDPGRRVGPGQRRGALQPGDAPTQATRRALCLWQRAAPHGHEDDHQRLWRARIPTGPRRRGRDGAFLRAAHLGLRRPL